MMLYLGIDEHGKQLTVCARNEEGCVGLRRQVSTEPKRVRAFFEEIRTSSQSQGGFAAILEVCGFNDWLLEMLEEYGCKHIVLIHPDKRSKRKTDHRDANSLSEILWLNRKRLANGEKLQGVRRIVIPDAADQESREVTALRQGVGRRRTRTINQIKNILRRHNLLWDCPTKGFQTAKVADWLQRLVKAPQSESKLTNVDKLNLKHLLEQWKLWDAQLAELDTVIQKRAEKDPHVKLLSTIPGIAAYSGLTLACRIGSIQRFPGPRSLANYFGLTPRCRNSGESTDRLGSITRDGSPIVRFILAQCVLHVLRRDRVMRAWYGNIKRRRGSKIARVAVMRRLCTIIWHMLKHEEGYVLGGIRRPVPELAVNPGGEPQ
jgi:transposase